LENQGEGLNWARAGVLVVRNHKKEGGFRFSSVGDDR